MTEVDDSLVSALYELLEAKFLKNLSALDDNSRFETLQNGEEDPTFRLFITSSAPKHVNTNHTPKAPVKKVVTSDSSSSEDDEEMARIRAAVCTIVPNKNLSHTGIIREQKSSVRNEGEETTKKHTKKRECDTENVGETAKKQKKKRDSDEDRDMTTTKKKKKKMRESDDESDGEATTAKKKQKRRRRESDDESDGDTTKKKKKRESDDESDGDTTKQEKKKKKKEKKKRESDDGD